MRQGGVAVGRTTAAAEVPLPVRFLSKIVLEVLPAALASVIGAFLFAYCQFGPAAATAPEGVAGASAASAQMVQLVRDEHAMVRDFIVAQQVAAKKRAEADDAANAQAAADARLAAASLANPPVPRSRPTVASSAAPGRLTAALRLPPLVIANVSSSTAPATQASPVSTTLAVPRRVVAVTFNAMRAIGGIPSWIGQRVGAWRRDSNAAPTSAAS